MKQFTLSLLLLLCSSYCFSQQLGYSTVTPFGGSSDNGTNTLTYNSGESINSSFKSGNVKISEGLLNCSALSAQPASFINVSFFFDENENGVKDNGERNIQRGTFKLNGVVYNNFSQSTELIVTPGSYIVEFNDIINSIWELTSQKTFDIELTSNSSTEYIAFGVAPEDFFYNTKPAIQSSNFRCNEKVSYSLIISNEGTVIDNNTMYVQIDSRIDSIIFPEPPDVIVNDHLVGWNYDLLPTEKRTIKYCVISPPIVDASQVGAIFTTKAWVGGEVLKAALYCYDQEHRCSYDPNDKLVNPNRPDNLNLLDSTLYYTIRFQNTGNDYAKNVLVTDTLDNNLNLSTFNLISTSHPNELKVVFEEDSGFNNIIQFRFDNIFLLDSIANEPASHGHIMYSIDHVEGVALETEITNTAYIYFDFNPAIVTNTTSNILVDEFPIVSNNNIEYLQLSAYPNPTNGVINFDRVFSSIEVFDVQGRKTVGFSNMNQIDLKSIPDGQYLIKAYALDKVYQTKIILNK